MIVGGGTAGCILASRLTEDPHIRVLLLEAGPWDRDPLIHLPLGFGKIAGVRHDWGYSSQPEPSADGRRIECARGKVIGGSSSVNAMAHVRGHRADYDRWAASGLAEWSYAHALPYFKRQESWEGGESRYRGGSGPVQVRKCIYRDPIIAACLAAGEALGFPVNDDYNAERQEGFALQQMTIGDGRRSSAAVAYLRPALRRGNLEVRVNALAVRILFAGSRASGVRYEIGGKPATAHAGREVLLAGGVINTPQLLMISGIGDPLELKAHGIEVKIPLPGVGRNLQDHVMTGIAHRRKQPGPFQRMMRYDRLAIEFAQAALLRRGMATDVPSTGIAFVRSSPEARLPDVQILTIGTPYNAAPYLITPYQDLFVSRVVLLRPRSRGRIRLARADPRAKPLIFQNMLTAEEDWSTLRAGLRLLQDLGLQSPLEPFIGALAGPCPASYSDADLNAHIRATAVTFRHTLGSCRMGLANDPFAVVDPQLRVLGAEALRVVDASVMPDLVGGNINAAVMMIAEKAADLIRGRTPLAAADV